MTRKPLFITVTDYDFFPGTLAAVNSLFRFHPQADVVVVDNNVVKKGLTENQRNTFSKSGVNVMDATCFSKPCRHLAAWELKAYAARDLAIERDVIVGFDSDLLFCSAIDDLIDLVRSTGGFVGGQDGDGVSYGDEYEPYGFKVPAYNPKYMSTSLYAVHINDITLNILNTWAELTNYAVYNGRGYYPGHGDQGILNAVVFRLKYTHKINLLPNRLWSQHWCYWQDHVVFEHGVFINRTFNNQQMRSLHCSGNEKFWTLEHSRKIHKGYGGQKAGYAWFLYNLCCGKCCPDPERLFSIVSSHLYHDVGIFRKELLRFTKVSIEHRCNSIETDATT